MTARAALWWAGLAALGLWAGWHVHRWGQPVPVRYERVAPDRYRAAASGEVFYHAEDTDGDGTVDRVYPEGAPERGFERPHPNDPEARWLILCLDGVPYEEMKALWDEGYFREFFPPSELIAPFPSDSETSLTDAFHAGPVPGYEHRYFDRAANRLRGGVRATLTKAHIPYLSLLDYDMSGLFKGITYVVPRKSYRADLGRLRREFLASDARVFLAHIASSDSLYHILTREEIRALLVEVDSLLRELYYGAGGRLRITLFSDHGNSLAVSQPVPLADFLASQGWRLASSLGGPRDAVVPAYGLVGFLAVYCQPESRAELAQTLAGMEGADLVVYAAEAGVVIESRARRARLDWADDGSRYRYRPETGDPLRLVPVLRELAPGRAAGGWVSADELFAATAHHVYPDAAERLRQWAGNHVLNRADLLVSLAPGYYHGSGTFARIVTLHSTHGSLDRAQSVGFALSTDGPLPPVLRASQLLPKRLAGAADR